MNYTTLLIPLTLLIGCANSNESFKYAAADAEFENIMEVPATEMRSPNEEINESPQITQKLVKTGGIDFESGDVEEDYKKILAVLAKFDAYVENENQSKTSYRINYSMTIRVPATNYDSLFQVIATLPDKLDNRYSNVEDVTEHYYDLKSRIKNKKALEQRYIDLLKKASDIKDILEIERNLNQVRTDIERLQGQFNYLSKQVSLSTINLNFYEVLPYSYDSTQRPGFGARLLNSLDNGWQGFLSFLVGITALWPFILLVVLSVFLFRRWRRKRRQRK